MKTLKLFLPTLLIALACTPAQNSSEDALASINRAWEDFVIQWENEQSSEVVNIYTSDAVIYPPESDPLVGKDKIAGFYQMLFDMHASNAYFFETNDLQINNDQAVERGTFKVDWIRNDESEWTFEARMVAHWVQNEEGNWKIRTLMFNPIDSE